LRQGVGLQKVVEIIPLDNEVTPISLPLLSHLRNLLFAIENLSLDNKSNPSTTQQQILCENIADLPNDTRRLGGAELPKSPGKCHLNVSCPQFPKMRCNI